MCPACISTATLVAAGTVSAGGMSALVVTLVHAIKIRTIVQRKSKENAQ